MILNVYFIYLFLDTDTPLLQHQESKDSSRPGYNSGRQNSGRKVDLSNSDDVPILEQKSSKFQKF
jgi:hypothetical protein